MRSIKTQALILIISLFYSGLSYSQSTLPAVQFQIKTDVNFRANIDSNKLGPLLNYSPNNTIKAANQVYKAIIVLADTLNTDSVIVRIGTNTNHDNLLSRTFPVTNIKGLVHRKGNVFRITLGKLNLPSSYTAVAIIKDKQGLVSAPKNFYK